MKAGMVPDSSAPLAGLTVGGRSWDEGHPLGRTARLVRAHLGSLGARIDDGPSSPGAGSPQRIRFDLRGGGIALDCALTGWDGLGDGPFDEAVAQAACGLMSVHGRATGGPRRLGVDYVSVMAGVLGTQGVLAGALGALRGIPVRRVELAASRAAVFSLVQYIAHATADEEPDVFDQAELSAPHRPPFVSSDGLRFELETLDAEPWKRFWTALGVPPHIIQRSWRPFMMRYGRATAPLPAELPAATAGVRFTDISDIVARSGMTVRRIRSLAERRADPGMWPATGTAAPWHLHQLGEAGPGLPAAASGPELPLAGIRVVESTRRMQGPLATRMLSLLGAEVIRIEPPGGDPMRGMAPLAAGCAAGFRSANQGKAVVEIDFKTAAGRDEVLHMVRDADVFLHNWAPGKAGPLGLDAEDMRQVNPGLVYAYASGWGDALGPTPPLGTDFQVQAHSGVADQVTPEGVSSLMIITDVLGAAVSAEGVLAGLVRRHRWGHGVRVESSLLSAATTMLHDELAADPAIAPRPSGVDGVFRTADGHLAVAARTPDAVARLAGAVGVSDAAPLVEHLAELMAAEPGAAWESRLRAAGVAAAVVIEDVSALPEIDRFAPMFSHHGCAVVTAPWRFR